MQCPRKVTDLGPCPSIYTEIWPPFSQQASQRDERLVAPHPSDRTRRGARRPTLGTIGGFAVMMVLDVALG
jgi:hypothetical protein